MLNELLKLKERSENIENYRSYGIIILKSGESIEIGCLLRSIRDIWGTYKKSKYNEECRMEIEAKGTIVTNGVVTIDLEEISTIVDLYAEEKIERIKGEKNRKKTVSFDKIIEELNNKEIEKFMEIDTNIDQILEEENDYEDSEVEIEYDGEDYEEEEDDEEE